jgi:two-component system phosphate regulon sensor histidine kinase PhoR
MRRSLFLTFFLLAMTTFVPFALLAVYLADKTFLFAALAIASLIACAIAVGMTRYVRKALAPLQALAEKIPDQAPKLDDLGLQRYSEFDGLAGAIAGASTKSQAALDEAQEERRELEALLDSMQDAVVAVDAAGRIQWANQAMQRLLAGVSASGATAASSVRVGHALVQTVRDPEVLACVKAALEERVVCERRTTSLAPGRIFEVNASPMPAGGAVAVLHDITRIEEVERTQRDFVANVSHELRTPLTSISGYVETLLDMEYRDGEESLSPVAREFLGTILKNATRMSRLTEDLLTMARVESREAVLHPRAVRADVLVRDAVAAMSGMVQDAEAVLEIGETTGAEVFVDADAMVQVLGNLIENGIKYGQAKDAQRCRVVVSAREVWALDADGPGGDESGAEGAGAVEFSVRDFGAGIASEHLTRIFERFYRVDKARSRESGGTGLGLAIARHMVEMQGGTIRAESELGAGSEFLVRLPQVKSVSE